MVDGRCERVIQLLRHFHASFYPGILMYRGVCLTHIPLGRTFFMDWGDCFDELGRVIDKAKAVV